MHSCAPNTHRPFDDRSMIHLSSGVSAVVVGNVDRAESPLPQQLVSYHHAVLGDFDDI